MSERENDPPRWADTSDAPPAWRAFSREEAAVDALAPPELRAALRSRVRRELVSRTTRARRALFGLLSIAAAALVALAFWWPTDHGVDRLPAQIAVRPEPTGIPRDAGPSEDAAPPFEAAPPRDDLPYATVEGNGCGVDVDVVLQPLPDDVASIVLVLAEHPSVGESRQEVAVSCEGRVVAELEGRLFRDAPPAASAPVELSPPTTRCDASYTVSVCARQRDGRVALGVAQTSDDGTPAVAWPVTTGQREFGRPWAGTVLTPSGPVEQSDIRAGHLVVTVGSDPALWPDAVDSVLPPLFAATVERLERTPPRGVVELRLEDGRVVVVSSHTEVWMPDARALRPASEIVAGDRVLDSHGRRVGVIDVALDPDATVWIELDVRTIEPLEWYDDLFFVDDVLVRDAGPQRPRAPLPTGSWREAIELEAPLSPDPRSAEPLAALPRPSADCSLRVDVEVDLAQMPADVRSIALVHERHTGRGRAGLRLPLGCSAAGGPAGGVGGELPLSLFAAAPERAPGRRVLRLEVPGWHEDGGDWHPREPAEVPEEPIQCDAEYDVIACARGSGGALRAIGAELGRWAVTGPACFAAGTLVSTSRGPRAIETLRRGERLRTVDPESGEPVEVVLEAHIDRGVREIVELSLDDGTVLRVTAEHPLYDARSGRFREAGTLVEGDVLLGEAGREVRVLARMERGDRARVYDLSVTGPHTYLAGGVLAHNY